MAVIIKSQAGETWEESVLLSCNLCGYRCKCNHGVKTCECPFDNNTLKMEDCHIEVQQKFQPALVVATPHYKSSCRS